MKLLVICVNYYSDQQTIAFVEATLALARGITDTIDVAVSDNTSRDSSDNPLSSRFRHDERVTIVPAPENPGYFPGAALALTAYLRRKDMPDWVIVSNTDITFPDADFLCRLHQNHGQNPPGVVAPEIIAVETERDQNPHLRHRPSRLKFMTWRAAFHFFPTWYLWVKAHQLRQVFRRQNSPPRGGRPGTAGVANIFAPHGAFVIFHKSYFTRGGDLKHVAPLYGEELFVGETARRIGVNVVYDPSLRVRHEEHVTTGKLTARFRFIAMRTAHRQLSALMDARVVSRRCHD